MIASLNREEGEVLFYGDRCFQSSISTEFHIRTFIFISGGFLPTFSVMRTYTKASHKKVYTCILVLLSPDKIPKFVIWSIRKKIGLPSSKLGVGKLFVRRATFGKNVAAEGRTLSLQGRKVYSFCK